MGWNIDDAISWARRNANAHSTGYCARAVVRAIDHGGVRVIGTDALNLGTSLRAAGFTEMSENTHPIKGDISVIQPIPGHPYGHAAIFDGTYWYSDFKQQTMYPGSAYRSQKSSYKIYRMR